MVAIRPGGIVPAVALPPGEELIANLEEWLAAGVAMLNFSYMSAGAERDE